MKVKELIQQLERLNGDDELVISIRPKYEDVKHIIPMSVNGKPQWGYLNVYSYPKPRARKAVVDKADAIWDEYIDNGCTPIRCKAYTFDSFIKRYERALELGYRPTGPFEFGHDVILAPRTKYNVPLFSIIIEK